MLGLLKWVSNVLCGGIGGYLFDYFQFFYYREFYPLGGDINIVGFAAGYLASHFIWKGISASLNETDTKPQQVNQSSATPKENPNKITSTIEDAGFCLNCGHDSLWATVTRQGDKEERTLQCSYCDPSLKPEFRSTRSDKTLDD